jgi:hypothetical protein
MESARGGHPGSLEQRVTAAAVKLGDAPHQVEPREESLPALGADEVLVETIYSAISAGTESVH